MHSSSYKLICGLSCCDVPRSSTSFPTFLLPRSRTVPPNGVPALPQMRVLHALGLAGALRSASDCWQQQQRSAQAAARRWGAGHPWMPSSPVLCTPLQHPAMPCWLGGSERLLHVQLQVHPAPGVCRRVLPVWFQPCAVLLSVQEGHRMRW